MKTKEEEQFLIDIKKELSITCYATSESERNIKKLINQFKEEIWQDGFDKGYIEGKIDGRNPKSVERF